MFVISYYVFAVQSTVLWCPLRFPYKTMFSSPLPPVVWRRAHVLFTLFVFVCVEWCPTHIMLCFYFVFLRLLYPMLPVYLDCPFLIAPSVFSNVYEIVCFSLFLSKSWFILKLSKRNEFPIQFLLFFLNILNELS